MARSAVSLQKHRRLTSLLKKVSGTLKPCEKPEIYSTRKVPDTFFNKLLRFRQGRFALDERSQDGLG